MLGEGGSNQLHETLMVGVRCMLRISHVASGDEKVIGILDRMSWGWREDENLKDIRFRRR